LNALTSPTAEAITKESNFIIRVLKERLGIKSKEKGENLKKKFLLYTN
jgi:hypothetical protein